ncbi:MAG TPA: hypothetical protein VK718_06695 [Ferruginibacter sp.]|nr:hypothetical protein [Ferruginibacter sp.]
MKKTILFAAVGLLMLTACKKNNAAVTTNNTITATIDGVIYTYNVEPSSLAHSDSSGSNNIWYEYESYAINSNGSAFDLFCEKLNKTIASGTYGAQGDSTTEAYIEYDDSLGGNWESATIVNPATITITSAGGGNVQGTFQGTLYSNDDSTSAKKVITNGKFNFTGL